MPDYSVGSASIKIGPSFTDFAKKARAELKAMDLSADVQLKAQVSQAESQLQAFARQPHTTDLRVDLDKADATTGLDLLSRARVAEIEARILAKEAAQANLDELAKARTAAIQAKADGLTEVQAEMAALARTRTARIQAMMDRSASSKATSDFSGVIDKLKKAGTLNLKVTGVVGAASAIAEIAAIGEAALEASRAVALITPAAGFAGLASIGSVAAGIHGIPGAFKAINQASDSPAETAAKQVSDLDAVSNAEYGVTQANSKLSDAYRDASRSIRDMNDQLQDQKYAVQDASLSVDEAAKNLQKVQYDPTSDADTRKRAVLQYQEAVQRQKEAGEKLSDQAADTAEANAKGVSGSDQVVQALHAQTVATQELAKAQAAAAAGSGSGSKVNDALAKLSPNAKQLVTDIRSIGPAWHDAQQAGQDALTAGLGPAIKDVATVQLPGVKEGIVGIDTAINSGLKGSLSVLSSDLGKADVHEAMQSTATALQNAAGAAAPLTDALLRLVKVGSEGLPGIGTAIDNAGHHFDDFVRKAEADGSLKKWIEDGETSAKELAQIVEHVGSSIESVFRAAGDNGETLRKLDQLTDHMSAFLKSADGQDKLREFFTTARGDIEHLEPILKDLPGLLSGVYGGFRTWSEITLPFLKTAGDLLSAHPGLVRDIVTAYLAFKTLSPILDGIQLGWRNANKAVGEFKAGLGEAKTATEEVGTTAEETAGQKGGKKGVGSLLGALGGVIGVTAAGGPLGIALGAATLGLGYLQTAHQNAADAAQHQKDMLEQLNSTLDNTSGKSTQATIDQTGKNLQSGGFFDLAKKFGIDPNALTRATAGVDNADQATLNAQLIGVIASSLASDDFYKQQVQPLAKQGGLTDQDVAAALAGVPAAVAKYKNTKTAVPDLGQLKNDLSDTAKNAASLAGAMNGTNASIADGGKNIRELNEATKGSFDLTDSAKQKFKDLGVAVESVPDAKDIIISDTSQDNIKHLQDLHYQVTHNLDGTLTVTVDDADAQQTIKQLQAGPYTATLDVRPKIDQVLSGSDGWTLADIEADRAARAASDHPGGRATGGPVYGPGTDSSDSILMRLSNGEYVIRAAAARKLGPAALTALNSGQLSAADIAAASPAASPAVPSPADNPAVPQSVLYPQAPLPTPMSDKDIQKLQDQSAVDAANSERNKIYADPTSSAADKRAADLKYLQSQNALTADSKSSKGSGDASLLSAQGAGQALGIGLGSVLGAAIGAGVTSGQGADFNATFGASLGSKEGGELGQVIGQGVLGFFGLDNSALSSSNPWNQALQQGVAAAGTDNDGIPAAYLYQPQNLPSVVTPPTPDINSPHYSGLPGSSSVSPSGQYNSDGGTWRTLATQMLAKEGFAVTDANVNAMLAQIQSESSGDPNAVNLTDSNAQAGHPSQGLLQTIPSTFEAYRDPSLPDDITDPAANMAAALRYYRANYGDDLTTQWGHGHGYADGGLVRGPGGPKSDAIKALLSGGEYVVNSYAAQRNLPLLEAINSSSWNPVSMARMTPATGTGNAAPVVNRDHSVRIEQVQAFNHDSLVTAMDRWTEQQSMGALAMYS